MKIKKKTAMLASFALGTVLFASTALADIVTKSGYDQLKDALKLTAENCSNKYDSFTLDYSFGIKDNGKTLKSNNEVDKLDRSLSARENVSNLEHINGDKFQGYRYMDKTTTISHSVSDPTWYVTEFTQERKESFFNNPFKENRADDLEKIADALVGSLKDYIVVTENPDGSKLLSGSLSEVQIPSLVNAAVSFQSKQEFNNYGDPNNRKPHLTQDIFVKEAKGSALLNKEGVVESISGTAVLSGKDEQGQVQIITFEISGKLTGINSTTVSKPDLMGKKVVKTTARGENYGPEISDPQKFEGKFSNDILIEQDDKLIKIGERFIEISHMDNQTVAGRYYEEYKQGFEEYANTKRNFSIDGYFNDEQPGSANFNYIGESGAKLHGKLFFNNHWAKINADFPNENVYGLFDSEFSMVLE